MNLKNINDAEKYLFGFVPKGVKLKYPGNIGLERTRHFLHLLGNPQEKMKIVHLAGTSGKGSTASCVSFLLHSQGFKIGLHLSPHIIDIRERMQINNKLIGKDQFVDYLNQIIPAIEKMKESAYGPCTYFEILVGLSYFIFAKEKVDYAVIETGMGGKMDATNVVEKKLAILTKFGLDHMAVLGNTINKIALDKVEIIHKNNLVVSANQRKLVNKIIQEKAKEESAEIFFVKPIFNFSNIKMNIEKTIFDFQFEKLKLKRISIPLLGEHQVENCSLALASLYLLAKRDKFSLNIEFLKKSLSLINIPGRIDIRKYKGKTIVIDGAHNPQKMRVQVKTLKKIFGDRKLNYMVAFKEGKDFGKMLKIIKPLANKIFVTSFFQDNQDLLHLSSDPKKIVEELKKIGVKNYHQNKDIKKCFNEAMGDQNDVLVVTGSLYYLNNIYGFIK